MCVLKVEARLAVKIRCLGLLPHFIFQWAESHVESLLDKVSHKHSLSPFKLPKLLPKIFQEIGGLATIDAGQTSMFVLSRRTTT